MDWRIESTSWRNDKPVAWTITKGTNKYGDGPAATVCTVTSSREDAALIAAAPEMYELLRLVLSTQRSRYGYGALLHIDMMKIAENISELLAKARGE